MAALAPVFGAYFSPMAGLPKMGMIPTPIRTISNTTTAGATTMTPAQLLGGLVLRDGNGGARTDTLPTAELLLAALPGAEVGISFETDILNTTSTAVAITIAVGTGITLATGATATIAQLNGKRFLFLCTNATPGTAAFTVYSLGTYIF